MWNHTALGADAAVLPLISRRKMLSEGTLWEDFWQPLFSQCEQATAAQQ